MLVCTIRAHRRPGREQDVRRQPELGGVIAGSGRDMRLDPLSLPARFTARDNTADGCIRVVELDRERVVLRRVLRGMQMTVNLPVRAYRGVAIALDRTDETSPRLTVRLEHNDRALSVPLYAAQDSDNVAAEWQLWAQVLRLPLLVADPGGALREPFPSLGAVRIRNAAARRRRRNAVAKRRPRIVFRRRASALSLDAPSHAGEREIIARD